MLSYFKLLYDKGFINPKTEFDIEIETPLFNTKILEKTLRHVYILKILPEEGDMNFEVQVKQFDIKMFINFADIKLIDGMTVERYGAAFGIALDGSRIKTREL